MKKFLVAAAAAASLSACASIVSSNQSVVSLQSTPSDASVVVYNNAGTQVFAGATPTTVTLKTNAGFFAPETYTVEFSKPGYTSRSVELTGTVRGWYFGNILFGGLIGMLIVDPATGAMWTLATDEVDATLSEATSASLEIRLFDDLSDEEKSKLVSVG